MTKASGSTGKDGVADFPADFGRLAAEMLERALPMHPLMAPPVAAMAAATVIGFGFSTQLAGAFFGALQGVFEETNRLAEALDDTPPEEPRPEVRIKPENIRPAALEKAKLSIVGATGSKPTAQKKAAARAKKADDLKLIAGIGPKLEQVLNAKGIRTFAEIAAWTDAEIAKLDAELGFNGRVARDDWTGQAKALSAKGRKRT
ncbi:NADH-quinone oxidoreductase subunit E [Rhizobium mongolense subsp. loessense]|uniref:NADH-quinone oxidoreductase subunit E n=1 Tax=Rhizobium mongolense subsp. loessense TaxID=158890 RepID=A0A1G4P746_9HYPH|nr:5' DNA nuclease [Rhizobium mongolense]SCW28090.1 NADH-quinone oxidoreductase subunit E [Rhizobium mongolense subsp. loessense]